MIGRWSELYGHALDVAAGSRLVLGVAVVVAAVLGFRWARGWWWRRGLVVVELAWPRGLVSDQVAACVGAWAAASRRRPIAVELIADHARIRHYLYAPVSSIGETCAQVRAHLPGVRTSEPRPLRAGSLTGVRAAVELRLSSTRRGLAVERAESATAGLLSALHPLNAGERVCVCWIISGTRAHTLPPLPDERRADERRALRTKTSQPLARAVGRVTVTATHRTRAKHLAARAITAISVMDVPGAVLLRRWVPWRLVAHRAARLSLPLAYWPAVLNSAEAAGALGIPLDDAPAPGVSLGTARQLPPSPAIPTAGNVVGYSNYPGMTDRPVALRVEDRLRHAYIVGPTGVGKSTLIARMALSDISQGYGCIVVDPKGDLVEEIAARIPDRRLDEVIIWDPSATNFPIGFNLLRAAPTEQAKELVVDNITHIMATIWRSSWGPRTSDVIRNSVLTLANTTAADGSAFTLAELPVLLTNDAFRRTIIPNAPEVVRSFWNSYDDMSLQQRAEVIGPSLNKIRALTTRTALRLALGQSEGINLADVFARRKILLVSLGKGALGSETAHLLGSLLVAGIWSTTLARATIPAGRRNPVFCYLDEFQDITRISDDLADILAQARGAKLGMTLAHQYIDQLPVDILHAVLGTVRTQIVFQTESDDARTLAKRFAPLTADDLTGLAAWEIAMRPCVGGTTLSPVTATTPNLSEPLRDPADLAHASRARYGQPRADVESAMTSRTGGTDTTPNVNFGISYNPDPDPEQVN